MRIPLDAQQLAEARQWAADLGVPESVIIEDAETAKGQGAIGAMRASEAIMDTGRAGAGQMMPGHGPEPAEAEAG